MPVRLILAHVSTEPTQVGRVIRQQEAPTTAVFLGQDYLQFLRWQAELQPLLAVAPLRERLAITAQRLRRPFLDLISTLGRRRDSPAWWTSRVSERNTAVSPLFLYCCYLRSASDLLAEATGPICVIAESWALLESLAVAHGSHRVLWACHRPLPGTRAVAMAWRMVRRLGKFLWLAAQHRLLDPPGSANQVRQGCGSVVLLRTYVDEDCLGLDGVFRDRYFPGLRSTLEAHGCVVTTLPVLFNLKRSIRSTWQWLRASPEPFLNPFRLYRAADYAWTVREAWRQRTIVGREAVVLDGLRVTDLFREEQEDAWFDRGSLAALLTSRLPGRIAESNWRVDVFVDTFENMISEKGLTLGVHRDLPHSRVVGFQHGALYPLLLCNYITASEAEFAPVPDRVVCNGAFFRQILIQEGLPHDRVTVATALRYVHLWQPRLERANRADTFMILVPLSLMLPDSVELVLKVLRALEGVPSLMVMVKPHPMSSASVLLAALGLKSLPEWFKIVGGAMGDRLAEADLMITLSSSSGYEALAAGLPVVTVGRDTALDLNALAWYPEWGGVCYRPEEIRAAALQWLTGSSDQLDEYRRRSRAILREGFAPPNAEMMSAWTSAVCDVGGNDHEKCSTMMGHHGL